MRIFTGIQPTGRKHLGNYIGAIRQYVEGQDRAAAAAIYCIVDLHAITMPYDPAELRDRVYDTLATLIAAGLDPERSILFRQGDVQEHTELCWLLSSVTAVGELNRMHQFRDKSVAQRELVAAGVLFYPVLQAADVLAYKADEVPVGEDQREHLELMRDVARRFNSRFGEEILVVPEHRIPAIGARIMDLQDPTRKMSTTGGSVEGTVYVLDEPKAIEKKLKRAVTDSDDPPVIRRGPDKPGVTNLVDILAACSGRDAGGGRGATSRRARLRRPEGGGRRRGRRRSSRRCASATRSCGPTRRGWRRSSRRAPSAPGRCARDARRGARGDGRRTGPEALPWSAGCSC